MVDYPQDGDGAQALDQKQLLDRYQFAVTSGCGVSPGTNDLTVQCASGSAIFNGSAISVSAQDNVSLAAADATDPRKDVVYLDATGTLKVATGTPEAAEPSGQIRRATYRPAPPALSATNAVVLAEVWVPANTSDVTVADVSDRRLMADLAVASMQANTLNSADVAGAASGTVPASDGAGGLSMQAVAESVFGRTGAVTAQSGDYTPTQTGFSAYPLALATDTEASAYPLALADLASPFGLAALTDLDAAGADITNVRATGDSPVVSGTTYEIQKDGTDGAGIINFKTV